MNDVQLGITLKFDGKEVQAGAPEAAAQINTIGEAANRTGQTGQAAFSGLSAASHEFSSSTSEDARKILDRYDPVGAKLAQLKADFDALNKSAMSGGIGPKDDARTDLAYSKITAEIKAIESAANGVTPAVAKTGAEMAAAMEKGMFATAGARRELIVLGHEAMTGNFSRMPGSLMVLAERAHLTTASILGIGGGLIAAAGGAIALGIAFHAGAAEVEAMNHALAASGDFAGVTRGQMRELAQSVSESSTLTIGQSKEIVTALVNSGRIGASALAPISKVADDLANVLGKDVAKMGPELVKLFEDPAKGAKTLNDQMHFLTITELEHINTLVRMGQTTEAQTYLAEKLTATIPHHASELSTLGGVLHSVKTAASDFWDALSGIGREATLEENLAKAKMALLRAKAGVIGGGDVDEAQASFDALQAKADQKKAEAAKKSADAQEKIRQGQIADMVRGTREYKEKLLREEIDRLRTENTGDPALDAGRASAIAQKTEELEASIKARGAKAYAALSADIEEQQKLSVEKWKEWQGTIASLAKQGEISDRQALAAKHAGEELALADERATAEKRVAIARDAAEKKKALGALLVVEQKIAFQPVKEQNDIQEAAKKEADLMAKARIEALGRSQSQVELAQEKFSKDFGRALSGAQKDGDKKKIEFYLSIQTSMVDKGKFEDTRREMDAVLAQLAADIEAAKVKGELGIGPIFTPEAEAQLRQAALPELERLSALMQQLAGDSTELQKRASAAATAVAKQTVEASTTWETGANKGATDYLNSVGTVAKQTEILVTGAFKGMEDALVSFVKTGKLDFKSMADSIITDLIRMQIQASITRPLATMMQGGGGSGLLSGVGSWFKGLFSANGNVFDAGTHLTAFATGGAFTNSVVSSPTVFPLGLMGEAGPEAIMPLSRDSSGRLGVKGGGGSSSTVVYSPAITIDARGADAGVEARLATALAKFMAQQKDQVLSFVRDAYARKGRQAGF
ncbi:MAG: phage tail length tape measure family protein [Rhodocyclaceae bacterium]|nr:phage tail length tape measure family protein [Rhodocyclaceae bacterium]